MPISLVVGMLAAIDLKDEAPFEGYEINKIMPDRSLPLDLDSSKAMRTQKVPKPPLCIRHVGAKGLGVTT